MAYTFFGVTFEDINHTEYRLGFYDDGNYQPIIERRDAGTWVEVNQLHGTGAANQTCRNIRADLPISIAFPPGHTQNERIELINQLLYNIQRRVNENVNYRGAHS